MKRKSLAMIIICLTASMLFAGCDKTSETPDTEISAKTEEKPGEKSDEKADEKPDDKKTGDIEKKQKGSFSIIRG